MLRRISIALVLLLSILATLPLATSLAHNLRFQSGLSSHNHHHSRAWWRRHRARVRRRLAMAARKRALIAAQNGNVPAQSTNSDNHVALVPTLPLVDNARTGANAVTLPSGWSQAAATKDSSTFKVAAGNGIPAANATLTMITAAPANSNLIGREQKSSLAGVAFSDLRHSVIDRMISAGGWVVNDRERQINGQRVFQVIAQTPASNDGTGEQIWNFYFTEINGRIYSLTTRSTGEVSAKLTADAESFLSSFRPMTTPPGGNK